VPVTLDSPVEIGGVAVRNRLYRAPLLEHAGQGADAADRLVAELEPAAESGVGLVVQGATPVRGREGRAAPGMTGFDDPDRVASMRALTDAIHDHGGRIFCQLAHGGLRSMEVWHRAYRRERDVAQRTVSDPPWPLRAAEALGFVSFDARPLSTEEVYDLATDFGEAADRAVAAGYDGVHLAGATMGVFQQFLSPFYNDRDDEFGGPLGNRTRFFEVVLEAIRDRVGPDVPVTTKVPAETRAPWWIRDHLTLEEGVRAAERLVGAGYDALVPVTESPFWDHSIIRGEFPERAWGDERFADGYESAFGGPVRARLVELASRIDARGNVFEPAWNAGFCRRVRGRVDVPVLCVGGMRERERMDRLLGDACDMVGVGRPFYAEPRLPARLLSDPGAEAVCENCNNCVVPQAAGEVGVCRTPSVLRERGRLEKAGAYERGGDPDAGAGVDSGPSSDSGTGTEAGPVDWTTY
jgi:2,4-dienoyl-CoA reductase-like NADH-dependent reductase (Old Yellow Enzyme family)